MSRGREVTVRTDVLGAVCGSGVTSNGDIEKVSGGRDDWTIVANSHDKELVVSYCVFVQAIFGVHGSEGGRDIRQSRGGQLCK